MAIPYTTDEQIERMRRDLAAARQKMEAAKSHRILYGLKKAARIAANTLFYAAVAALFLTLVSVLVTKGRGRIPSVMGYSLFVVESGSMEPTLDIGTVFVSKAPKDASALTEGTIITFLAGDEVITHRIIEVQRGKDGEVRYITKGDSPKNAPDADPVLPDQVLGAFVLKVPLT